ncbi:MAG: hypothetical protein WAK29_14620 [Terriglobales bacterium]
MRKPARAESSRTCENVGSHLMDRSALLQMFVGAVFMFGFGLVWLIIGLLRGRSSPLWLRLSLLLAGMALAGAIGLVAWHAVSLPPSNVAASLQQEAANRQNMRQFYLIFGAELAAIFIAVVALNLLHYPDFILCAIAVIVGVHFIPLARLFQSPFYYGTALAGCAIGLAGLFVSDAKQRQQVVGLSFGILLWATGACIAGLALLS